MVSKRREGVSVYTVEYVPEFLISGVTEGMTLDVGQVEDALRSGLLQPGVVLRDKKRLYLVYRRDTGEKCLLKAVYNDMVGTYLADTSSSNNIFFHCVSEGGDD